MLTRHYLLTNRLIGSLLEWQNAIEAARFPVRLRSVEGSLASAAVIHANLSNGSTAFRHLVGHPNGVIRPHHSSEVPRDWRYAVTLSDMDTEQSTLTVTLAAIAYGAASNGVIYSPDGAQVIVNQFNVLKEEFDQVIGFYLDDYGLEPEQKHPYSRPLAR